MSASEINEAAAVMSRRRRYTTRTILTAAALGAAVGIVLVPVLFVIMTAAAPCRQRLGSASVYGAWRR
ncbi:hypothetical protein [Streptomyces shenzhenensis]|uniref:Uncharacterized protein n=1 Tax=Streptomyces shenzhenensis TaxID=943815 RepID=A0A3M0I2G6_9ACTN|nr:hypothetical protein [Streptomyces shenzhenensis]RMB82392.1 hypothetical protein CTZ28_30175 [Streptomyces shenzhenensis]